METYNKMIVPMRVASVVAAFFAVALVVLLAPAAPAFAQGDDVMKLERFPVEIHYQGSNRRVADKVHQIIEREAPRLTEQLGMQYMRPIQVRVEDDITPYRESLGGRLPTWGVAFAIMEEQLIVVDVARATRAMNSLEKVIPHELSHVLIYQRVPGVRFPIWFLEGLAQWQAGEWSLVDNWQLMNAVWGGDTPSLWQLVDRYPKHEAQARTAYRLSHAAFSDLFAERPQDLSPFLDNVVRLRNFDHAFSDFFGVDVPTFTVAFHKRLESRYQSKLLFFQSGPLFSVMAVLFLIAAARFYVRKRRKLKELERLEDGLSLDE